MMVAEHAGSERETEIQPVETERVVSRRAEIPERFKGQERRNTKSSEPARCITAEPRRSITAAARYMTSPLRDMAVSVRSITAVSARPFHDSIEMRRYSSALPCCASSSSDDDEGHDATEVERTRKPRPPAALQDVPHHKIHRDQRREMQRHAVPRLFVQDPPAEAEVAEHRERHQEREQREHGESATVHSPKRQQRAQGTREDRDLQLLVRQLDVREKLALRPPVPSAASSTFASLSTIRRNSGRSATPAEVERDRTAGDPFDASVSAARFEAEERQREDEERLQSRSRRRRRGAEVEQAAANQEEAPEIQRDLRAGQRAACEIQSSSRPSSSRYDERGARPRAGGSVAAQPLAGCSRCGPHSRGRAPTRSSDGRAYRMASRNRRGRAPSPAPTDSGPPGRAPSP